MLRNRKSPFKNSCGIAIGVISGGVTVVGGGVALVAAADASAAFMTAIKLAFFAVVSFGRSFGGTFEKLYSNFLR